MGLTCAYCKSMQRERSTCTQCGAPLRKTDSPYMQRSPLDGEWEYVVCKNDKHHARLMGMAAPLKGYFGYE